jgi:hypothetical protein
MTGLLKTVLLSFVCWGLTGCPSGSVTPESAPTSSASPTASPSSTPSAAADSSPLPWEISKQACQEYVDQSLDEFDPSWTGQLLDQNPSQSKVRRAGRVSIEYTKVLSGVFECSSEWGRLDDGDLVLALYGSTLGLANEVIGGSTIRNVIDVGMTGILRFYPRSCYAAAVAEPWLRERQQPSQTDLAECF